MSRKNQTTFTDVENGNVESRQYFRVGGVASEHGTTHCSVRCPFCQYETEVYLWPLAGSGKRCDCGALFGSLGYAHKRKDTIRSGEDK